MHVSSYWYMRATTRVCSSSHSVSRNGQTLDVDITRLALADEGTHVTTPFTCFTSTRVQILTPDYEGGVPESFAFKSGEGLEWEYTEAAMPQSRSRIAPSFNPSIRKLVCVLAYSLYRCVLDPTLEFCSGETANCNPDIWIALKALVALGLRSHALVA